MRAPLLIVALLLSLPGLRGAEPAVPVLDLVLDLRAQGQASTLSTWAHASGKALLKIECAQAAEISCHQFLIDGNSVVPLANHVPLTALKPGLNLLEIPLPAKVEHGKLLFKIVSLTERKAIANLMVNILPKDAWVSLSKHAKNGQLFIDPAHKEFKAWADAHELAGLPVPPAQPVLYYFGKPSSPDATPLARFIIFERDTPDPMPVIEVLTFPAVTKIILPPGFLQQLPQSAAAQALLLKHLNLLP